MPVEQATPPECRSGARAATGAGLHWCCEPPVAAAPGLMRDGTGSGSWSCRRGCTRASGSPAALLAATIPRPAAQPETAPPRPHTRPTAPAGCPAYRPARSAPFYRRIRIDAGNRAMLAPAPHHPGLAPGAALLPAQAGLVQRTPDRIGADLRQPVIRLAQSSLQQAQRPGRRTVLFALWGSRPFGQDALLRVSAIADPRATPMPRPHGREPVTVEATDPGRDRLGVPSSDLVGGRRVGCAISEGQQGSGALDLGGGRAERAAQAGQGVPLVRGEQAQGIVLAARHGTPRSTRIIPSLYQSSRQVTH